MADSSLVTQEIPANVSNYTPNRAKNGGRVSMVTLHHVAAVTNVAVVGRGWQNPGRGASSHYGVNNKDVAQYVPENAIAWTNKNWNANASSVTIEVCNSGGAPNWEVSNESLNTTIWLVADIAKRYNLYPLVVGTTLTYHSMYANTNCPGPYLLARMQYIADEANNVINGGGHNDTVVTENTVLYIGVASHIGGGALNVRTGPGTNYSLLATYPKLNQGNQFEVLQDLGQWLKIRIANQFVGFVYSSFVEIDAPNTFEPFAAYADNLNGKSLNVRTGPGTNYSPLAAYPKLNQGNQFIVVGSTNGWYLINIANRFEGWVAATYVTRQ